MARSNRVPRDDAFAVYVSLGVDRSHAAIAEQYGVSKRAITKIASLDNWAERLRAIEEAARKRTEEQLVETMAQTRERHLRTIKAICSRALASLRDLRFHSAMECVRAIEITMKLERSILADPDAPTSEAIAERHRRDEDSLLSEPEDAIALEDSNA